MPPTLLQSPALAHVPHAFTTRRGGVSSGIFGSLNFGNPSDLPASDRDPPANIRENFDLVLGAIGAQGRELVEVHQVHGPAVHTVLRGFSAHPTPHDTKADAIVTNDPGRMLAVRVADCAPVLFASHDGRVVGVAHAGWRGVVSGVVPATVQAMRDLGADRISAAIGPCIGIDHFEVGPEVAAEFERAIGPEVIYEQPKLKPHIDLKLAIRRQLERAGAAQIDTLPHCTACDADLFFSHRRDQSRSGRMIGIIGAR